jgi:methionine-rich copper-binding protein CopC
MAFSTLIAVSTGNQATAHAEVESSSPPINGTVTALPSVLTLTFSEEVKAGRVSVTVTGPDGARVDDGGAAVDLNDPERITVNVNLFAGGEGTYTVAWQSISNIDDDEAEGSFTFAVQPATTSPVASSGGTPVVGNAGAVATATINANLNGNPLGTNENYDSRAFAISVGAGLVALAAIVGFWFLIRPRNPRFGPRAKPGQD